MCGGRPTFLSLSFQPFHNNKKARLLYSHPAVKFCVFVFLSHTTENNRSINHTNNNVLPFVGQFFIEGQGGLSSYLHISWFCEPSEVDRLCGRAGLLKPSEPVHPSSHEPWSSSVCSGGAAVSQATVHSVVLQRVSYL